MSKPVRRIRSRYLRWRGAPPDADSWRATPHAFERDDPIPEPQARPPQAPLTLTSPPSSTGVGRVRFSTGVRRIRQDAALIASPSSWSADCSRDGRAVASGTLLYRVGHLAGGRADVRPRPDPRRGQRAGPSPEHDMPGPRGRVGGR